MRTIIHLSDLHFGATHHATVEPLVDMVRELAPDLVVVSGDFTQRARPDQFQEARAFLDRLPSPQLVVPGNHDIPLFDIVRRVASPYAHYERIIARDRAPFFLDDELAVAGIDSTRPYNWKGGEIAPSQLHRVAAQFERATQGQLRIVVTHHPFDVPPVLPRNNPVDGGDVALATFAELRVNLVLAGHLHMIHEVDAAVRVRQCDATLLHAGTAMSNRSRGEPNSFFVLRVGPEIVVETFKWNAERSLFDRTGERRVPRIPLVRPAMG